MVGGPTSLLQKAQSRVYPFFHVTIKELTVVIGLIIGHDDWLQLGGPEAGSKIVNCSVGQATHVAIANFMRHGKLHDHHHCHFAESRNLSCLLASWQHHRIETSSDAK